MAEPVNVNDMPGILWQDRKHHLWFPLSFTKYYIEDERLMIKTGDIIIKTRVDSAGEIVLKNIKRPMEVRRMLSSAVEAARQNRNVVGKEFYGGPGAPPMIDLDGDGIPDFEEHNF